ncbi:type III PLP-dependent enzyme [Nocardioides sp. Soil777]|uniref:type III PLP-dependent enzyme n=1 Tax=Nocardioides sp. Soil777 TaxID=1736409 RepID=UPI0019108422|nr:type III PLP-dependent enzyme [Nocardioides sp. Soil777]
MTIAPPFSPTPRQRRHAEPRVGPTSAPTTPILTVDLGTVRDSYRQLHAALPGVDLHYAVKANPSQPVLDALLDEGACWDVASPGEIDVVLAVDPDPARISYGNTVKKPFDIGYAHARGVRQFSVDCDAELDKLIDLAPGATLLVRIATSGAGADWALGQKFGCDEVTAGRLLARAVTHGHPVGICFHVGSQQHEVTAWDEPLATTTRLRGVVRARGSDLAVVDLGGGFPAHGADPTPDVSSFGNAIMAAVGRSLGPDVPPLMAEPGRALVADAGTLETEVVLVSERAGRRWVYVDVGLFSGLAETMGEAIRYRITAHRDGRPLRGRVADVVLAGPTCDSVDILYQQHRPQLPLDLRVGDRLRIHATGAYTTTYSSVGFNGFAPLREVHR